LAAESVFGGAGSEGGAAFFSLGFDSSFLGGSGCLGSSGGGFSCSDDSLGSLGSDLGCAASLSPKAKEVRGQEGRRGYLPMIDPRYRFHRVSDPPRHCLLPTQTIELLSQPLERLLRRRSIACQEQNRESASTLSVSIEVISSSCSTKSPTSAG